MGFDERGGGSGRVTNEPLLVAPGWLAGCQDAFIDFCILCGCDYASTIKGIGPVRALQHMQVGRASLATAPSHPCHCPAAPEHHCSSSVL